MADQWASVGDPVDNTATPDPYADLGAPVDAAPVQQYVRQITSVGGKTLDQPIVVPADATDEQIRQIARQNGHNVSDNTGVLNSLGAPVQAQPKAPDESVGPIRQAIADGIYNGIDTMFPGVGTFLRGHADAGKAFTEHAANAVGFDYGPEVGGFIHTAVTPSQWGDFGQNLDNNVKAERATLETDSQGHPIASLAGELSGAGIDGALGNEAGLANAGRGAKTAANVVQSALYGSGAAGPGNRLEGAATGAALGTLTDMAIPAAKALFGKSASTANQLFDAAANRQGVSYMAADLPNSLKSKFATALTSLSFGAIPLAQQGEKNVASAAAAASRVAGDVGTVADKTGAGQAAQSGAEKFIKSTGDTLNDLESKIPIAASAPATVSNTRVALNNLAQSFSSNPKLAAAFRDPKISAYLDALTPQTTKEATGLVDAAGNPITRDVVHGGGLSWQDLRDFRTRVGQIIGQPGLTSDGAQMGQLRSLYGALSDDIRSTAQAEGPQALNAWTRWNNYARARANRIDNVVSLIMGKDTNKGPQSAYEAMQRLANERGGDPIKLAQALRSMPQDEANTVRATMISDLGDASPGQQNGPGDVFNPAQWVTNWNKISDRAKNVLFTGDHRRALDDLANLFSGMKSSSKFANNSKTGISVLATANAGLIWAHLVLGSLAAGLELTGGKLLSSPSFARRVAGTPLNAKGAAAYWSRPWVKGLINQNPAIAGEIKAFQSTFLSRVANDNASQSLPGAASPNPGGPASDQQGNDTQP